MTRIIRAADLFCGAGGSSTGLALATEASGQRLDLTAVNHSPIAIETHAANHPSARHLCHDLDNVDPRRAVGGQLDLLIASPECTHHSIARGGKPADDQSRSTAWHVIRWADALRPKAILVENVREFESWGPLGTNGRPLKRRRGETFQAWLTALRSLGYSVSHRVLNAADFGDPTTRERLFVLAVRGQRTLAWPEPSHSRQGDRNLYGSTPKWRSAREIIDWSLPGASIFNRKRPLSANTLRRIEAGLRKFCGLPFAFSLAHTGGNRLADLDRPLPTLTTAKRGEMGLVQPFILPPEGIHRGNAPRSTDDPIQTITAGRGGGTLVQPFVIATREGCEHRVHSVDEPLGTVTAASNIHALCNPFIIPTNYGERPGQSPRCHSADSPVPTLVGTTAHGVVQPFIVKYNGTALACSVDEPLDTVSCRDRYGLVLPDGRLMDIRFRMLQPHELAAAMSFPATYKFCGNKGQVVRQIGNAVPVRTAKALCESLLAA